MLSRPDRLAQLLGAEVGQHEMRARFGRIAGQQSLQFDGGVARIVGLLQRHREVEASLGSSRIDGQRVFVRGQALRQIARFISRHAQIIIRVAERRVGNDRLAIFLDGFAQPVSFLGSNSLGEPALRLATIAGPGRRWRPIAVASDDPGRRRRRRGCRGNGLGPVRFRDGQ